MKSPALFLALAVLTAPVLAGLAGTVLPAFGYLPVLGAREFTLRHFYELAAQPGIIHSSAMSFVAGIVTSAVALGVVFLFVAAHAGSVAFRCVQHLVSPLLSVPHAAAAIGLAFLIAPSGMIARLLSPELTGWERPPDLLIVHDRLGLSMMAGLIVKEIPFLFLILLAALPQVDLARSRAIAASLGYGRIAGFAFTVWPALYRQIRLAVFAVIAFSSSVVDVALILGPTTPPPLAIRILTWISDPDLTGRHLASAGALLQLCVTLASMLAWMGLERLGRRVREVLAARGRRFRYDRVLAGTGIGLTALAVITVMGGLGALVLWSIAGLWPFPDALPSSFSLQNWQRASGRMAGPLSTTLVIALSCAVIATAICIFGLSASAQARGQASLMRRAVYLPLVVPQISFLFGLHHLFVLINAANSLTAVILAHLVFVLPYVFLSLGNHWQGYDTRYEIIARAMGKSGWQVLLRIRLPMMMSAILTAAAVGLAVSVGQYLPTVLIGGGRLETITTEAVALASGGNRRIAGIYAVLQLLLPLAGFLIATLVPALLFRSRRMLRV